MASQNAPSVEQTDGCQADSSGMETELRGESGPPEPEAGEDYRQYLCRFLGKERADYFLGSSSDHLRPSTWDPTMTSANRGDYPAWTPPLPPYPHTKETRGSSSAVTGRCSLCCPCGESDRDDATANGGDGPAVHAPT
ncbi:unnamed protein product [Arctogadus glacialis]